MSRSSYTYQPFLMLNLTHPHNFKILDHVTFIPTVETKNHLKDLKIDFKSTLDGFLLSKKSSEVFQETKNSSGEIIYTPKETIEWLKVENTTINLEFYCQASKVFINATNWQNQGPQKIDPNQSSADFTYIQYEANFNTQNASPDINSSSTEVDYRLDQGDFEHEPVAKLKFILAGHLPNQDNMLHTLNL